MVRTKHQWLTAQFFTEKQLEGRSTKPQFKSMSENDIKIALMSLHQELFGLVGIAGLLIQFSIQSWAPESGVVVLKVNKSYALQLKSTIILLNEIDGRTVIPRVIHSSATYVGSTRGKPISIESKAS